MARAEIDQTRLRADIMQMIHTRAAEAFAIYNATPHKKDDPDYPFRETNANGDSVKDPQNQRVDITAFGAKILIESPGAIFSEFGNDPGRSRGDHSAGGKPIRPRTKKELVIALREGSRLQMDGSGRVYITNEVESYEAPRYLERAVRQAFGLPLI